MFRNLSVLVCSVAVGMSVFAATSYPAPDITVVSDNNYGGALEHISDNGLWAVGYGKSIIVDGAYSFPRLYDLTSKQVTYLFTQEDADNVAQMTAYDVTNDGSLVVGSYNDYPAVWRKSTGMWEIVENNHDYKNGRIDRVTPDGRFAIGTIFINDGMYASMRLWDLTGTAAVDITPENLPKPIGPNIPNEENPALPSTKGCLDESVQQLYAGEISADGSKFTGMVNYSYPSDCWTFIYDRNTSTWTGMGMQVTEEGDYYIFDRNVEGLYNVNTSNFVAGSNILSGEYYSTDDDNGFYFYDSDSKELTLMPESAGYESGLSDALGTVYASRSYEGPMRDWYFKVGDYWYDFAVVAKQLWGIDWEEQISKDGLGLTGTLVGVSYDCLTLHANDYSMSPYNSYFIKLPAPLPEIVGDFNLLGNYFTTPVGNSSFAYLREVKVTFDRPVDVVGSYSSAKLLDEDGNVAANSIALQKDASDSKSLSVIFRNFRLQEGKKYTVVIPAGTVSVAGDAARLNDEIRVSYKGRPDTPVKPLTISPVSGSEVSRINATSNPVSLRFDAEVAAVETCSTPMNLYLLGEDGSREVVATLSGSISGDVLSVYPLLEQRLAYGSNYEVVIPAGTVADISGANPNEEIVISYVGAYIPEGPGIDGVLFEDNFDQGLTNKWMFYDGASDFEPSDLMASWGFTKGMPWWTAMDSEDVMEQSAVSHSMFKTPEKADAWMVTSIMNISDDSTVLSFKSQSYRDAQDVLKVYVYVTDDIYTSLTPSIVNNFRLYGDLVYEEVQVPGRHEELLAGDWRENLIHLDQYVGKNIYVAFVNDNRNKSAVFVDDVKIAMEIHYGVVNLTPTSVVDKDEVKVTGLLQVMSDVNSYTGYSIELKDADGNVISTLADPDVVASKGWRLDFEMPEALPLAFGKETKYTLDVKMGDVAEQLTGSVQNLAIQTSKKVVVEEYTGQGCDYCPLGHAALDWIQKDFPGLVLPIELHSYPGDRFSNNKVVELTGNLGLQAAPTARINRGKDVVSPMSIDPETGLYVYKNEELWYGQIVAELESFAPADIEITSVVFDGTNCVADVEVTYALDLENANPNLLIELCEDNLVGFQSNGVAFDQPALGEWGANGIYGGKSNLYYYHNVLRNWEGTTFNGTGGLLPSSIKAGEKYNVQLKVAAPQSISNIDKTHVTAMLIDSESGKVLNADRRFTGTDLAVDAVDSSLYSLAVSGRSVSVAYPGALSAEAYDLTGTRVGYAEGSDTLTLDLDEGGIILLSVRTSDGLRHHKLRIR